MVARSEKTPSQGSHAVTRARYYQLGDTYTIIVVRNGEHHFFETETEESARLMVEVLDGG